MSSGSRFPVHYLLFILIQEAVLPEHEVAIRTPDGTANGVLFASEDGRRLPGVIFLTDVGGIRASQHQMGGRLAAEGYAVLLPNIFYRTDKPPVWHFPLRFGEPATMQRFGELTGPLTPDAIERDAGAYVDFLAGHESVGNAPMGVVGLCFSGALAVRTAAARPDRIAAAASFHGGRLYADDPSSPHLVLPHVKARLYFGHATDDRSMPQEVIGKLDDALESWGGRYESEIYEGARHGWTVPDNPAYNQPQAERAFEKLKELFADRLK